MPNASTAQSASAPPVNRDLRLPGEDLSLTETLRVMDVARELRDGRQTAEEMFRADDVRQRLREKLLRTAQLSGDNVTAAEIDAAIEQYLSHLNTYADPKPGLQSFMAHCWVWRKRILAGVAATAIAVGSMWFLFASPNAPLSPTLRAERAVAAEVDSATNLVQRIEAMTQDPQVLQTARSLQAETTTAQDVTGAIVARNQLEQMASQLASQYTVQLVSDVNAETGLERAFNDRVSMFYVIVQAKSGDGKVIPQTIRDSETDQIKTVDRWAVQISETAYRRIAQDKSDGVLNETVYAIKTRGQLHPTIELPGAIESSPSTITQW